MAVLHTQTYQELRKPKHVCFTLFMMRIPPLSINMVTMLIWTNELWMTVICIGEQSGLKQTQNITNVFLTSTFNQIGGEKILWRCTCLFPPSYGLAQWLDKLVQCWTEVGLYFGFITESKLSHNLVAPFSHTILKTVDSQSVWEKGWGQKSHIILKKRGVLITVSTQLVQQWRPGFC